MLHETVANFRAVVAAIRSAGTTAPKGADVAELLARANQYRECALLEIKQYAEEVEALRDELLILQRNIHL